jgi:hypothetical protein
MQQKESCLSQNSSVNKVPLGRYFLFVGGMLIALLFIAERYWPVSSNPAFLTEARFDKSTIRISSSHRWPDRIVLDTSLPTITSPAIPIVGTGSREAFAQSIVTSPTSRRE